MFGGVALREAVLVPFMPFRDKRVVDLDTFVPGQRWVSDAEADQGLGTVIRADSRTVTLAFLATGETRTYAIESAPLSRAIFSVGSVVVSHEGWAMTVASVRERQGCVIYEGIREDGRPAVLDEGELDNFLQLNRPADRLFSLRVDADKWFELRYQTLLHVNRLAQSDLWGLIGVRTLPIPHQLYIAHEVARRMSPRVLLADEVGLGKTIEAGLIVHHQLLHERARRVLVVTPGPLVHQWLVEMLRRFNLQFSVFDEARWASLVEEGVSNPFETVQLLLCELDFICHDEMRLALALDAGWDLLVVDEAHHLQWREGYPSREYLAIERLAAATPGVLLLTGTPEQLGKAAHFARLHLLDPDRYPDLETFERQEAAFEPVADVVEALLGAAPLDTDRRDALGAMVDERDRRWLAWLDSDDRAKQQQAREVLVEHLLDRHGVGRVLFRNTRAAVKGFPGRRLVSHPLPAPAEYEAVCVSKGADGGEETLAALLAPEMGWARAHPDEPGRWTDFDPRVPWLIEQLEALADQKVLLIAAHAETVLDLANVLRLKRGIHAAVFHEGMRIVERDRAAAFFADEEAGAPILLCSEIGSEGRNFQFAHHLILFDLPLDPDLLEQRIGRLDRIGQREDISIHVPFLEHTAQQVLFDWYQHGLNAFEAPCPAAQGVFIRLRAELVKALTEGGGEKLIARTAMLANELNDSLQKGRDRLLEYNSCRPAAAARLVEQAIAEESPDTLFSYLASVFDCYGVDYEPQGANSWILRPGNHLEQGFPGLLEDGMTVTCHRETALSNEDQQYLSWEHPMVRGAMDRVLDGELGNTGFTAIRRPEIRAGSIFLECLYVVDTAARSDLVSRRYFPPALHRIVVDAQGREVGEQLSHEKIAAARIDVDKKTRYQVSRACLPDLKSMLQRADELADSQASALIEASKQRGEALLGKEIERLHALKRVNPAIREDEIEQLEQQRQALLSSLERAMIRLDAVRVIVAG